MSGIEDEVLKALQGNPPAAPAAAAPKKVEEKPAAPAVGEEEEIEAAAGETTEYGVVGPDGKKRMHGFGDQFKAEFGERKPQAG